MGQKVSPVGLRIGVNKSWQSNWYAKGKDNAKYIKNDDKIRKMLEKKLKDASVSSILIERDTKKTNVVINTAKPGVVIGHGGDEIEKLKNELNSIIDESLENYVYILNIQGNPNELAKPIIKRLKVLSLTIQKSRLLLLENAVFFRVNLVTELQSLT